MQILSYLRSSRRVTLGLVTFAIFADTFVYDMVVPFLPDYLKKWALGEAEVGLLFGSYALALLGVAPLAGRFADRLGRKKALILGLFGLVATTALYGAADSFWACLVARFLQGAAGALIWVAGLAFLAAIYPREARGQAMGAAMTAISLGTFLGPPLGGMLFALGGYALPFWCAGSMVALVGLLIALLAPENTARVASAGSPTVRPRGSSFYVTCGAVVLGSVVLNLLEPTLPLHLGERLHAGPMAIGMLFTAATLTYGLSAVWAGRVSDRFGRRRVMIWGLLATLVVLPLVALPDGWVGESCVLALLGCACAFLLSPTLPELADATERSGSTEFGAAYAWFNTAYAVGMMVGPAVGGLLMAKWGFFAALTTVSAMGLVFVPVLFFTDKTESVTHPNLEQPRAA